MKSFIIACMLAGVLILSEVAFAAPTLTDIRIGDISQFDGEVLIRTQKKWIRLKQTPHPLYATDKVVTRRGRAEVEFTDGGRLRLDVDTNIGIYQRQEESVKEPKQNVTLQQVNILVGKVWFNVKIRQKGRALKFKTPTMTAAIRGTQGGLGATLDGSSHYGLSSGKAKIEGQFSPLQQTGPYHFGESVPPSDPLVDSSPLQQAAVAAFKAFKLADQTRQKAKAQNDNATSSDLKARALAAVTAIQAGFYSADSYHKTVLEMIIALQYFNISNESLNKQSEDLLATKKHIGRLVTKAGPIFKEVLNTEDKANQQKWLAELEEINKQVIDFKGFYEKAVDESLDKEMESVFSFEVRPESDVPSQIQPPSIPENQDTERIWEGEVDVEGEGEVDVDIDAKTKTVPSPSQ